MNTDTNEVPRFMSAKPPSKKKLKFREFHKVSHSWEIETHLEIKAISPENIQIGFGLRFSKFCQIRAIL